MNVEAVTCQSEMALHGGGMHERGRVRESESEKIFKSGNERATAATVAAAAAACYKMLIRAAKTL